MPLGQVQLGENDEQQIIAELQVSDLGDKEGEL